MVWIREPLCRRYTDLFFSFEEFLLAICVPETQIETLSKLEPNLKCAGGLRVENLRQLMKMYPIQCYTKGVIREWLFYFLSKFCRYLNILLWRFQHNSRSASGGNGLGGQIIIFNSERTLIEIKRIKEELNKLGVGNFEFRFFDEVRS